MIGKRVFEGYLCIDHRESPGFTPAEAKAGRLSREYPLGKGKLFEAGASKCPYCERLIIRNPFRERERAYCRKLDRYICDDCDLRRKMGGELKPMQQIIDEHLAKHSNLRIL